MIRSLAWSKGVLAVEAFAGSLYGLTADTVFAALAGFLTAAVPTSVLLFKERGRDRAEERHFGNADDLGYAEQLRLVTGDYLALARLHAECAVRAD